jgi:hypothetical protein
MEHRYYEIYYMAKSWGSPAPTIHYLYHGCDEGEAKKGYADARKAAKAASLTPEGSRIASAFYEEYGCPDGLYAVLSDPRKAGKSEGIDAAGEAEDPGPQDVRRASFAHGRPTDCVCDF